MEYDVASFPLETLRNCLPFRQACKSFHLHSFSSLTTILVFKTEVNKTGLQNRSTYTRMNNTNEPNPVGSCRFSGLDMMVQNLLIPYIFFLMNDMKISLTYCSSKRVQYFWEEKEQFFRFLATRKMERKDAIFYEKRRIKSSFPPFHRGNGKVQHQWSIHSVLNHNLFCQTLCKTWNSKAGKTSAQHMPPSKSYKDIMINSMWKCHSQYFFE